MPALDFVHLHVHSSYSLLEGALPIARLAELAKADHQPALALTDTDNMFGALEFSDKLAHAGIQPIVGCALALDFGDTELGARNGNGHAPRQRIVLLAARQEGYRNLMAIVSDAWGGQPLGVRQGRISGSTRAWWPTGPGRCSPIRWCTRAWRIWPS